MKCYVTVVETRVVTLPDNLFKEENTDEIILASAVASFINSENVLESYTDCIEDLEHNTLWER